MEKKIVYVDMDGVIADLYSELAIKLPGIDLFEEAKWEERSRMITKVIKHWPYMFLKLKPIENSIESVTKLLNDDRFDIYFLSSPVDDVPETCASKRWWLKKHFGELSKRRMILTHRKDLCIGDYLIDDTTKNGAGEFKGKHIHFGSEEFPNWEAVMKYLI